MEVVTLNDKLTRQYQDFLKHQPMGLLYYTLEYRSLLHRLMPDVQSDFYVAVEEGEVIGVLPVFMSMTKMGVLINSSPFFGSYGGVLSSNQKAQELLFKKYKELLETPNLLASTVISNPLDKTPMNYPCSVKVQRICQITEIKELKTEDALWAVIDSSTRRNINKAKSSNLSIEVDNNATQKLAELHWQNMGAIGGATKPQIFFDALREEFIPEEQYRIYVAYHDGELIAALLLFYCNDTVEYFTPATDSSHRNLQPSALLISQAIQDASHRGYRYWNWGGTWDTQEGVYKFKKKWGAEDWNYNYYFQLGKPELLNLSREDVQGLSPYFYVLPYSELKG